MKRGGSCRIKPRTDSAGRASGQSLTQWKSRRATKGGPGRRPGARRRRKMPPASGADQQTGPGRQHRPTRRLNRRCEASAAAVDGHQIAGRPTRRSARATPRGADSRAGRARGGSRGMRFGEMYDRKFSFIATFCGSNAFAMICYDSTQIHNLELYRSDLFLLRNIRMAD
jgi:hypothetical protein